MATTVEKILLQLDLDKNNALKGIDEATKKLTSLKQEQEKINAQLKDLEASGQKGSIAYKNLTDSLILNVNAQKALSSELKTYNKQLELTIKANEAEGGSLDQKRSALNAANRAYAQYSEEQKNTDKVAIELGQSIAKITEELKAEEKALGDNRRNVGNYHGALDNLKVKLDELNGLRVQVNQEGFKQSEESIKAVENDIRGLGKAAIEQAGSLSELKDIMRTFANASLTATGEAKEAFKQLAAEARTQFENIGKELKVLGSSSSGFVAITQGVKTVISSFNLLDQASQAFGVTNQTLQQSIQRSVEVISVLNSLTEIQESLEKESALIIKGRAIAQTIWNGALTLSNGLLRLFGINMGAASTGLRIFSGALLATGIGAVVVLIGLLISNFDKVKKTVAGVTDAISNTKGVLGAILFPIKALIAVVETVGGALGRLLGILDSADTEKAKAAIKNQELIIEKTNQRFEHEQKLLEASGRSTEQIERLKLKAQADNIKTQIGNLFRLQQANGELTSDEQKQLDDQKEALRQNYQDRSELDDKYLKSQEDLGKEISKRRIALIKDDNARAIAEINRNYEDQKAEAVKNGKATNEYLKLLEDERNKSLSDLRSKGLEELNNQLYELALKNAKDTEKAELDAVQRATTEKLSAIRGYSAKENELRAALVADSERQQNEIRAKYSEEAFQKNIKQAQDQISAQLDIVLKGSKDELDLKIRQLEIQRQAEVAEAEKKGIAVALVNEKFRQQEQEAIDSFNANKEKVANDEFIKSFTAQIERMDQAGQATFEQKMALLKYEHDAGLISEADYNKGLDELNRQRVEDYSKSIELRAQITTSIVEGLTSLSETFATRQSALAQFTKALALFQISMESAVAFASLTASSEKVAEQAAGVSGPFAAVFAVAYYASGVARILSNIAKAKQLVQTNAPKAQFYEGGYTGDGDPRGVSHSHSNSKRTVHNGEYVTPNWMLGIPAIAALYRNVIEPMRLGRRTNGYYSGYFNGGFTGSSNQPVIVQQGMTAEEVRSVVKDTLTGVTIHASIKEIRQADAALTNKIAIATH